MEEDEKEAVKRANQAFYCAFEKLDIQAMDAIWSREDHIKCIHPGWDARAGWCAIRDSWVLIFNNTQALRFSVSPIDIKLYDRSAILLCLESISTQTSEGWIEGKVVSTNIFEKYNNQWLMVHHHGSPLVAG